MELTSLIMPSVYEWLIPDAMDINSIDEMALKGLFPKLLDLYPAVLFAIGFGILRTVLEVVLFKPVAMAALKVTFSNQPPVPDIDKELKKMKKKKTPEKFSDEINKILIEKTGLTNEQIKRYIWNKNRDTVSQLKVVKFGEAMWRAMFYSCFTVLGYFTLCTPTYAVWLSNTSLHFENWPHHEITWLMNLYYQIELGCYIHQLHWTEVSRSDALEMILHHVITIILILCSYLVNFTRVGTSILLTHDFADVFLEVGKCFNYTSKTPEFKRWAGPITDTLFGCFAVSFLVTRLVLYPRFMLYSVLFESPAILGMWSGYWVFASMLSSLQALHVFWFYLILRMIYRLMIVGEIEKDVRSDDDDGECDASPESHMKEGDKKMN